MNKNEVSLTNLEAIYLINNESTVKIKTIKGLTTELNLTAGVSAFLNKDK